MKKTVAIIPARGGSKGIPRKNLKYLNGKPLISYVISSCKKSKNISDIYVTTDHIEIANLSKKLGANVIDRPKSLANDQIPLEPVINHAITKIEKGGINYELIATIQLTSPLLTSSSIDNVIDILNNEPEVDSVISGINDPHLSWERLNQKLIPKYKKRECRQWLPDEYRETGGITCTRRKFITENNRLGKNIVIHEVTKRESIDIDDYYDFKNVESLLSIKNVAFILNSLKGIKKTIRIYDLMGGQIPSFFVIGNSKDVICKLEENNFKYKFIKESNLSKFLEDNKFDEILVEKNILSLIESKYIENNISTIEDFKSGIISENISSIT